MLLSEMLDQKPKSIKVKTINVKKVRDLLGGGECYTTMNGKTVYIKNGGNWYTCMGSTPLNHNFVIITNACDKQCKNCAFYDYDFSTGSQDCNNSHISQDSLKVYFTNGNTGCASFQPR